MKPGRRRRGRWAGNGKHDVKMLCTKPVISSSMKFDSELSEFGVARSVDSVDEVQPR